MTLTYGSVCSGIEAATQAWHPLGWRPAFFSEIEKFPSAVLAHHHGSNMPGEPYSANGVPNYGDLNNFAEWPDHGPLGCNPIDLLVGGTPCQDYSIAGKRLGMDGERGQLSLTYIELAARYRPRWIVWENVPGVLSSHDGRDFARFLGDLTGQSLNVPDKGWRNSGIVSGIADAYGVAWRVLDAQYVRTCDFTGAVPQRRRRVFVVGYLGDWRRAAAVLFDAESLSGNPPPRREAGQGFTHPVANCLTSSGRGVERNSVTRGQAPVVAFCADQTAIGEYGDGSTASTVMARDFKSATDLVAHPLLAKANSSHDTTMETLVAHTLKGEGFDASEDGTERGTPTVPVAYPINTQMALRGSETSNSAREGIGVGGDGDPAFTLQSAHSHAVAYDLRGREGGAQFEGPHETANMRAASGGSSRSYVAEGWQVRRLTPTECARLQGFPDDHCRIPWRGKPAEQCPDGPQYKAFGNSMPVNVMGWIGERIELVEELMTTPLDKSEQGCA
ncbi:MAG: DNA (cytosine-5-)-methyltransferase [Pseudomonadota bacterium]